MALTSKVSDVTIRVQAFGEVREVQIRRMSWHDENDQPVEAAHDAGDVLSTGDIFAARFRTGSKLWKTYALVKPSKSDPTVYELVNRRVTLLNRASAWIVGWWNEDKHGKARSQHISAAK